MSTKLKRTTGKRFVYGIIMFCLGLASMIISIILLRVLFLPSLFLIGLGFHMMYSLHFKITNAYIQLPPKKDRVDRIFFRNIANSELINSDEGIDHQTIQITLKDGEILSLTYYDNLDIDDFIKMKKALGLVET